ncbi:NAD(P)H-hydrate dehydratase [Culturomica massiliensis]|jgi:hydroxyethylthiazole kinase-like uncharacterized protein yjeF|uniref:NAD(P)H-hydrate dehydratase n=1 Tax=Culturomica massiliensis TaxID=1841857 RepID=UPI000E55B095|nr:NAD(P)H-hydrate dehydratase [Culturomica massiliensis]RHV91597.1 NAD(P)H-hydrate dehydratase [Odoribacter sp. OF09-27XD]
MRMLNKIFKTLQIAELDRYTIEHEPIKSIDLMERAAIKWTEKFLEIYGNYVQFTVIAGRGNNGGDGFVIARLLAEKGYAVTVFQLAGTKMSPDCEKNSERWKGKIVVVSGENDFVPEENAVIIDAMFGSGLNRPVTGPAADVIRKINAVPNRVVAVDIPSGLMGEDNSGNDRDCIVRADYTLTFQFPKLAFMFPENAAFVGKWSIVDIGLHPEGISLTSTPYYYLTERLVADELPVAETFAHKGTNGHGLLIAGSQGMMGAAILAAKAAVRSGLGLLSCHIPCGERQLIQMAVPEALVDTDLSECCFSVLKNAEKYDAIAVGPGLGQKPETVRALKMLLEEWKRPLILDADALNILAAHPALLDRLPEGSILTPHPKEFERLAGKSGNDFERLNKLSIFASRYNVCILLKGAHTVIVSPAGKYWFNMTGNPGMAKGGMGDVLTGVILALSANGMPSEEAVKCTVYAHGLVGDYVAEEVGERGVYAGLVAENMGKAWHTLELVKNEVIRNKSQRL